MLYCANKLGRESLGYKVLDENGKEIKYVKACDPEEGYYLQYNRLENGQFELEKTEDGLGWQAKIYKKTGKFTLIDTETGLKLLK